METTIKRKVFPITLSPGIGFCQYLAKFFSLSLFVLFNFFICSNVKSQEFNLTPLMFNFNGAVVCGKTIICYGDMGQLFVSTNEGNVWEQKNIGNFDEIYKIINFSDTLWGITPNSLLISTDCGSSWQKHKIDLDMEDTLVNIIVTNFGIYLRAKNSIMLFNRSFDKISEFKNDILRISTYKYKDPLMIYPFVDFSFYKFYFLFDKLIAESDSIKEIGLLYFEKDLSKYDVIDLRGKIPQDTNAYPTIYYINNVHFYKGSPVIQLRSNLYYVDSSFSNFNYFYKDTLFMNFAADYFKWSIFGKPLTYFFHKDTLYILDDTSSIGDYPRLNSIKKYISEPGVPDTFVQTGNYFVDNYWAHRYSISFGYAGVDVSSILSRPPLIYSDSILIFTYKKRGIIICKNFGEEWKLVSYLQGKPRVILNDSVYFFVNHWGKGSVDNSFFETFRTNNYGTTFIPAKILKEKNKVPYVTSYKTLPLFYIDETGKGFAKGCQTWYPQVLTLTDNFWDNINSSYLKEFNLGFQSIGFTVEQFTSNVTKIGDKFIFTKSDTISQLFDIGYRTFVCYLDTSFEKYDEIKVDTLAATFHIIPDNLNEFVALCYVNNNPQDLTDYIFEIRKYTITNDSSITYTTLHKIQSKVFINQIYEHNRDSIFITFKQPDQLYLYDRIHNKLQLLWAPENDELRNPMLMVISDRFYLVGRELFLENTNRNDLTQWREGKWDYGKPNFESVVFKGNVALAGLSDSLRPFNYYKITLKKGTPSSVEDARIDVRYYTTHFYATPPYPLPARNIMKSKLYWDGSFDLHQAIEGVYDAMGNKIEGKGRITITELGKSTAEMVWDCTGVASGIYFIVVRHNGQADTIPIIVE